LDEKSILLTKKGVNEKKRINDQFRVCFDWTEDGPEQVEITDYH